jgi:hypothetical protein
MHRHPATNSRLADGRQFFSSSAFIIFVSDMRNLPACRNGALAGLGIGSCSVHWNKDHSLNCMISLVGYPCQEVYGEVGS